MEVRGIKKLPGCSLVEVDGVIGEFFAGYIYIYICMYACMYA